MSPTCFTAITRSMTIGAVSLLFAAGCRKEAASAVAPEMPGQDSMESAPLSAAVQPEAGDPSAVVATVNGVSLTRGERDARVQQLAARQGVPPQAMTMMGAKLEAQVTDEFIDTTLLLAEAERLDLAATDAEIEVAISNIAARLPPGVTVEQAVAAQGVTLAEVRKDIRNGETLRKLYEQETQDVPAATEEAVTAFYTNNVERFAVPEQVSARHILISCAEDASEEDHTTAAAKAGDLHKQLAEGADFAELAAANSSCPSSERGGDLGSFGRGQMVPAFEEAAFSQEIDAVGPVIKTQFGYHIVQVTARNDAKTTSIEEAHDKIADFLTNQERNKLFAEVIEGLRAKAQIIRADAAE